MSKQAMKSFPIRLPRSLVVDFRWAAMLPRESKVLVALALFANREGRCFPSVARLGNIAGVQSRRKVQLALRELERLGIIRAHGKHAGRGMTVYEILGLSPDASEACPAFPPFPPHLAAPAKARQQRPGGSEISAPGDAVIILNEPPEDNNREESAAASLIEEGQTFGLDRRAVMRLELQHGSAMVAKAFAAAASRKASGRLSGPGAGWIVEALRRGFSLDSFKVAGTAGTYRPLAPEARRLKFGREVRERLEQCRYRTPWEREQLEMMAALTAIPEAEVALLRRGVIGAVADGDLRGEMEKADLQAYWFSSAGLVLARGILERRAGKAGA